MATRMHCNLRPSDATPVLIRFNYDSQATFKVAQPIRYRLIAFSLLIRYAVILTYDTVTLTFNL